jgi:hypothetical protein
MTLPQLSPVSIIANPTSINPLAHASSTTPAAVAGSVAQQNSTKSKSDSVTISREAAAKAAQAEAQSGYGKGTQTRQAAQQAKPN